VDAADTAAQFPNVSHVVVPNLGHVVAAGDQIGCTLALVHRFVKTLSPGDTSCVRRVRPVRTVPRFARTAAELAPLAPLAGDKTTEAQRRIAAAALETVGDIVARWYVNYSYADSGLRGGSFSYWPNSAGYSFELQGVRWTQDVAVSGKVSWNQVTNIITAQVTLRDDGHALGALSIRWNDADIDAVASISGNIDGATLRASRIAP
jgi:hypothetical protein